MGDLSDKSTVETQVVDLEETFLTNSWESEEHRLGGQLDLEEFHDTATHQANEQPELSFFLRHFNDRYDFIPVDAVDEIRRKEWARD